jgi:hypothetical protein
MMTVRIGEEAFTEADGGAMEVVTLGLGAGRAIGGATMRGWAEGTIARAVFGCGEDAAIREAEEGAGGAKRRVNGSRRRKGAGLDIAGATPESG